MNVTFKVLEDWPGEETKNRVQSSFKTGWKKTLGLIKYEVDMLGAKAVVVKADMKERDIRLDGWPRADARPPEFPGVIIQWQFGDAWYGRQNDQYLDWSDNLRGIALTLKALRDIERWGAASGEQYEGFRLELESGWSKSEAERLIEFYGGRAAALKATHPDQGGDPDEFQRVQEALKVMGEK